VRDSGGDVLALPPTEALGCLSHFLPTILSEKPFVPSEVEGRSAEADLSAEASAKAEEGMAEMSKRFHDEGGELYIAAGDREHH